MSQPFSLIPDGPKLRRLRAERGLKVVELARLAGHHRQTITKAERHNKPIRDVTAYRIANALSQRGPLVTPRDFIPGWPDDDSEDTAAEALAS